MQEKINVGQKKENATLQITGMRSKDALKTYIFALIFICAGIVGSLGSYYTFHPGAGMEVGMSVTAAASLVSIFMAGGLIGNFIFGPLADKVGLRFSAVALMGCITAGSIALVIGFGSENIILMYLGIFSGGLNTTFVNVLCPMIVQHVFGMLEYGQIFSWLMSGVSFLPAIMMYLIGLMFDKTGSYQLSFAVAAVLAVICLVITIVVFANSSRMQARWEEQAE